MQAFALQPSWLDGRLIGEAPPRLGPGCCTTGRYRAGRIRHGGRLAARLVRDAAALGLGVLDADTCLAGLATLGRARFGGRGEGIVRLEVGPDATGRVRVRGDARGLGAAARPTYWRAALARGVHPGPGTVPGAKRTGVPALEEARRQAETAGVEEIILVDRDGWLVEGARTNLLVLGSDGALRTPPLNRGAVAGVAREILLERMPELEEADVGTSDLGAAAALVAINAVRGAVAIHSLGGEPLPTAAGSRLVPQIARILEEAG